MRTILITLSFLTATVPLWAAEAATSDRGSVFVDGVSPSSVLPLQQVANDTGINVLIDHAHQVTFDAFWRLPRLLRENGFRAVGSQTTLDRVLPSDSLVRVRIPDTESKSWRPFGWVKAPEFNVVMTYQLAPNQDYLPEEVEALKAFVNAGGGLIILGGRAPSAETVQQWALNYLAAEFGGSITATATESFGLKTGALEFDEKWQPYLKGDDGGAVIARRSYGAGRVALVSTFYLLYPTRSEVPDTDPRSRASVSKRLSEIVHWVAEGKAPVGGELHLPTEGGGGGPIYPELDERIGDVVLLYAKNQYEELIQTVKEYMPKVAQYELGWMPSVRAGKTMFIILASGSGGGWAVNAYQPEEVGIIKRDAAGVLGVFAHELGHTLRGPANAQGQWAGRLPLVFSETQAGWFQGKAQALPFVNGARVKGHEPNNMFNDDKTGTSLDLATIAREDLRKGWRKLWWVFQKFDDRYGPTWYPRWQWVKNTRLMDERDRVLTWDEIVEDMSIAVGEDLFPFFTQIGTTLTKDRCEVITFQDEELHLEPAPITISLAGCPRLEPAGDFRAPIRVR